MSRRAFSGAGGTQGSLEAARGRPAAPAGPRLESVAQARRGAPHLAGPGPGCRGACLQALSPAVPPREDARRCMPPDFTER